MISARQLVRDLRPSSASSALFSLPGDDILPSRHSQPYRASAQPQGMHPRTRHTAREWCSGYPGPGVPGARLRASGTGVGSGRLPSRWFRLGPLLRRSPAQPASPPTTQRQPSRHPPALPTGTPAQPSNASATAQAHDRKASATSFRDRGFDSGRSFLAARLNQLWRARLPRHIRADSTAFPEKRRKNRFLVRLSVISLCKPPCGTHP